MNNVIQMFETKSAGANAPAGIGSETIVIKLGGSAIDTAAGMKTVLDDVAALCATGAKIAIVHGGGPAINRALDLSHKQWSFIDGQRVTDGEALEVVRTVLDQLNADIVEYLTSVGVNAVSMNSHCAHNVQVHKKWLIAPSGARLDLGFVGEVESIDCDSVSALWSQGGVPVFASLGEDKDGHLYNINADNVAMALAVAIHASKLVYVTDVPGILMDDSVISELHADEVSLFIESGVISGGMIPKVRSCAAGVRKGIGAVLILNATQIGALFASVTNPGSCGSRIVA